MSDKSDTNASGDKNLSKSVFSPFQGQTDFLLQEKVEKICHAVFFLIGRIPGDRPAGALVLEDRALECVSIASHFCVTREGRKELIASLLEIASLTRLAVTMGLIGEGSARVLVEEVVKTVERIQRVGALPSVSSDDLKVEEGEEPQQVPLATSLKELFSPHRETAALPAPIKKDISRTPVPKKQTTREGVTVTDREGQVLAIVQEKGNVSIKDISHVIKGCSEKTIQRTLLSLVERGALKKEGERRWSTYRLS